MLQKRFLFHFRFPCKFAATLWTKKGCELDESYRLPMTDVLESDGIDVSPSVYEMRTAWNYSGIAFSLTVKGKKQRPWCRQIHPEESDGLQLCLDTRNIKDVHRATRFCHRLIFLPTGSGPSQSTPHVFWLPIHRAKGHPNPIDIDLIKVRSTIFESGYRLDAMIPGEQLTGFDPKEYPNIGFHFTLVDRELGNRYFLVEPPFPNDQDPSLWGALELIP